MPIRVGMVSLGCSKNLVDSERMLAKLRAHGYQLVTEPGEAEIAIVNTCGFIQSAKEEAIETILELGALKKDGTLKKIILTGCLTERYKKRRRSCSQRQMLLSASATTGTLWIFSTTFSPASVWCVSARRAMPK